MYTVYIVLYLIFLIKVKIGKGEFHLVNIVTKFCDYVSTVVAVQLHRWQIREHAWNILIHAKIRHLHQHFSMAIIF